MSELLTFGLTRAEWDELQQLRRRLGQERFEAIRRQAWDAHIRETQPDLLGPIFYPGIWRAVLDAVRAAVRG